MDDTDLKKQGLLAVFFGSIGRRTAGSVDQLAFLYRLILDSLYWAFVAPLRGKGLRVGSTFDEMVKVGVNAIPIVVLISFSIGMILAMQSVFLSPVLGFVYTNSRLDPRMTVKRPIFKRRVCSQH